MLAIILAKFQKSRLIGEEKAAEGKVSAKQLKSKSDKSMQKAVEFILKKFEELV